MNLTDQRKWLKVISTILACIVFFGLIGCSKEAKKERHWQRGEKYFLKGKSKEATIQYKNVLQIDQKDAKVHLARPLS